jgi:uncharacterized protein (TIGR02246 family)
MDLRAATVVLSAGFLAGCARLPSTASRVRLDDAACERQTAALARMTSSVNAGDARGYASVYAPDATITIAGGDVLRGRDAIRRYEEELLRQYPGARLAFSEIWLRGDAAVVHYAVDCPLPSGSSVGHEGLLFHHFLPSGLVAEERRYLDALTPMAQMGIPGAGPARSKPSLASEPVLRVAAGTPDEDANAASVRAGLAALDSGDVVLDDLTLPQPLAGASRARAWVEERRRCVPDARSEIVTALAVGDDVLVEAIVRGTLARPLGPLAPSAAPFVLHRAAIVGVRDGKIARLALFSNRKELAEATGQWPLGTSK